MLDVLFIGIAIAFFALAAAFVPRLRPACRSGRRRGTPVSAGDVLLLALALGVLGYLVWALLSPERLG